MLSAKSRVSCIFSSCIFQSKNVISCYPLFFVSALQFEGFFIPMCGIQSLDHKLSVSVRPCMGIFRLILYVLDSVQVLLGVQNC